MPLWGEDEEFQREDNDNHTEGGSALTKFREEEESIGGTREEGKSRSVNSTLGGEGATMSLSPEAPIPPRIRYRAAEISTAVIVFSVSGGRRTTRANQGRCRWQQRQRSIEVNSEVENGSQGN